ncbi:MAG: citramalate synthase [Actinomycetia bacterium]|nr:citramalate synthase [Actinomycetes bacterium]
MTPARPLILYDTTLRDGMQREGMSVSVDEKLRIAVRVADLGVKVIEGGFPGSNPKDEEFFRKLQRQALGDAEVAVFGMTRGRGATADNDRQLRVLADCWAPIATVVGKTWDLHVQKVLRVDRDENLRMIAESVGFLRRQGKRVFYDAEHFFDAYAAHPEYALACLRAAAEAGAESVCLCDTNGAALPMMVAEAVEHVVSALGGACGVGIHAHNDAGCAVANSLVAVAHGAHLVQGTINGYGERCGNADLCSIIPALKLKMGIDCVSGADLAKLTDTAHFVAELCNVAPDPHQPYVGHNAFAHKGGMHIAAVERDPATFEHIAPALVGNSPRVLLSELSGRATIAQRVRRLGYPVSEEKELADRLLKRIKEKEHIGYHYEAADASFELLLRAELGLKVELFHLETFRIIVEKREDGETTSEATVKVHVDGERYLETAEGNGPVNALDKALRMAIERRFPEVHDIRLINYSVRILDEDRGTAATTRVLIDSSDGHDTWGSVGVGENVVEASWQALVDSISYGLLRRLGEERVPAGGEPDREQHSEPEPASDGSMDDDQEAGRDDYRETR